MMAQDWIAGLVGDRPWLVATVLALAAVVASLIAYRILGGLLMRAALGRPIPHAMLDAGRAPAGLALPLIALQLVWTALPDDLVFIGSVQHANALLLIGAMTWFATSVIAGLADGVIAMNPMSVADNLTARRIATQARVLSRSAITVVIIAGVSMALMTFPGARQVGASLLASAGVLGIVAGLAARPVFANLIAGLQIALAQPIRIDDVLIVQGEWGRVEEITGTFVVLKIWDERRLVIPLNWFIENPFQNWTRRNADLMGTVLLHLDFLAPLDALREHARKVVEAAPQWDKRVFAVQVVDASERTMQVRILVSSTDAGKLFDLRCRVREALITFLAREHPQSLPRDRQTNQQATEDAAALP